MTAGHPNRASSRSLLTRPSGRKSPRGPDKGEFARSPFPEDTMATATATPLSNVEEILGEDAQDLLQHRCQTVASDQLHLPGPDFVDRVWLGHRPQSARAPQPPGLFDHGRLAGTGYVSILPVDQGIEHSAGASFAQPGLLRSGEHRQAGHRRRLQRRRLHVRRPRLGRRASTRTRSPSSSSSTTTSCSPTPTTSTRSCSARVEAGLRHGRGRRSAPPSTSAPTSRPGRSRRSPRPSPGPRAGHGHGALVLPAQPRLQDHGRRTTTSPPT